MRPAAVIDQFETINIHNQNSKSTFIPAASRKLFLSHVHKAASIPDTGQYISRCHSLCICPP